MFDCIKYFADEDVCVWITPCYELNQLHWGSNLHLCYETEYLMVAGDIC